MSTLRLPPDEFALVKRLAAELAGVDIAKVALELTAENIRALLADRVTVVGPGETLVVRAHEWMTPAQIAEWALQLERAHLPFPVLMVPGAEFAKVTAEPESPFPWPLNLPPK